MDKPIEKLKLVKDFRKNKGKRHELWLVLLVIILGMMAGYSYYRDLGDFVKNNGRIIKKAFKLRTQKPPSYSTIRRVILYLEWNNLLQKFNEWAMELKEQILSQEGLAIDGKSLKATVINHDNSQQNLIVFASLFSQETALVLQLKPFENKKHQKSGNTKR